MGHRGRVTLLTKSIRISEWVERENRDGGHVCACGCGALIQVERRHHWSGGAALPPRSSSQVTTKEVQAIREEGLLTATAAARELGIGPTTLYQLEGKLFGPAERRGKRRIRIEEGEVVGEATAAVEATPDKIICHIKKAGRSKALCSGSTPSIVQKGGKNARLGACVAVGPKRSA